MNTHVNILIEFENKFAIKNKPHDFFFINMMPSGFIVGSSGAFRSDNYVKKLERT